MLLDFSELSNHFFSISDIFAVTQVNRGKTRFTMSEPRPTDALLFFASTTGVCYQQNAEPLYIPQGALVYMPKSCRYIWENEAAPNSSMQKNILFEFTLKSTETFFDNTEKRALHIGKVGNHIAFSDKVTIIDTEHSELYENLLHSLLDAFNAPQPQPLTVYRAAYELFGAICGSCRTELKNRPEMQLIKQSISLLEEYSAPAKSVREIAADCNISVSYYERLFRRLTGLSPTKYRHIHRINHIKLLLHNPRLTLDEIAEEMGYCDSGYLCRFFRQKTGMTPKEYRRLYLSQICDASSAENDSAPPETP